MHHYTCLCRSCAICRFRKGWSSLRRGSNHTINHIQRLWNLAIDTPPIRGRGPRIRAAKQAQRRAREQLRRHGFHSNLRCALLDHAKSTLIRDPAVPAHSQPLFAKTIYVDLLHWLLNCCDYGFAAIEGVMTKEMLLECDANTSRLPRFRNPDGSGIRQFFQVSSQTYLTAARRMSLMFVWTHALGTGALMLPAECRRPVLVALSAIQTIIIVTQGSRSYSYREWTRLLVDTSREYFAALETLIRYKQDSDRKVKPFRPMMRGYTDKTGKLKHLDPETDSDGDGGTAPQLTGLGHVEFSGRGIPHGILHFPEQLQSAGHIYMHDTCAPEASHKLHIKKAMARVRKATDLLTSAAMINWVLLIRIWRHIIKIVEDELQAKEPAKKRRKVTPATSLIQVPTIFVNESKMVRPTSDLCHLFNGNNLTPLRAGEDNLISQDARISYSEVCPYTWCTHTCDHSYSYKYRSIYIYLHSPSWHTSSRTSGIGTVITSTICCTSECIAPPGSNILLVINERFGPRNPVILTAIMHVQTSLKLTCPMGMSAWHRRYLSCVAPICPLRKRLLLRIWYLSVG